MRSGGRDANGGVFTTLARPQKLRVREGALLAALFCLAVDFCIGLIPLPFRHHPPNL